MVVGIIWLSQRRHLNMTGDFGTALARARSHLFPSSSLVESCLGFGHLKGWVGRPQHTCTHKRASLCVPYGVRVFLSWTCFCRAPVWSRWWLELKQKCLETRVVHHSGGSAWRYTLQSPAWMATDRGLERVVHAASSV